MTQLMPARFQGAEFVRNQWAVISEAGTPVEALSNPAYWAHVSAKMRPRDRVEVFCEDGSYYAEFLVLDAGKLFAKVALLNSYQISPVTPGSMGDLPPGYAVKYQGAQFKWSVLRGTERLHDGSATEADARRWLDDHLKVVNPDPGSKSDAQRKQTAPKASVAQPSSSEL